MRESGQLVSYSQCMAFTQPGAFSKSQINKAAKRMAAVTDVRDYAEEDYAKVDFWRSSHSFPLNTFQMNLRNTAQRVAQS